MPPLQGLSLDCDRPLLWKEVVAIAIWLCEFQAKIALSLSLSLSFFFFFSLSLWELRNIYHHPQSKKRKSSETNSGSIHPYGRYGNPVKTRKARSTIAILWLVKAIFEKRAAMVEVDTLISPLSLSLFLFFSAEFPCDLTLTKENGCDCDLRASFGKVYTLCNLRTIV